MGEAAAGTGDGLFAGPASARSTSGGFSRLDRSQMTGGETLVESPAIDEVQALQFERGAAIERYTVLDRIGAGAMGVVYTAYDPRLDRRVALKIMHARPGHRADEIVGRLLREAQALARLQHPNVVAIYDANRIGELVYLTMELVDGSNLSRWLKDAKRTTREILDTFVAAGRGLAAAHKAGIVHRDFKPDNVLVGRDGRVRVVDFGIARGADGPEFTAVPRDMSENISTPPSPSESASMSPFATTDRGNHPAPGGAALADTDPAAKLQAAALASQASQGLDSAIAGLSSMRLTRTGALVGTPAYMAPEQHMGARVDARADQFAFAVALFEALFGAHPFPAKNYLQLTTSVLGGKVDATPVRASVPLHVRRAILRALSVEPSQRFATMDDMLAALVPERRRRTLGGALAAAGVAAAVTGGIVWAQVKPPGCEGADRHLVGVWDEAIRERARLAFLETGQPYAVRAAETATAALDEYASDWVAMRREVCEASLVHREQSPLLLDRRMTCLDRHLDQLQATAALFAEADREVVQRSAVAVEGLPDLKECADAERLMHGEGRSLAGREEVARLEGILAHAVAKRHAAKYAAAQGLAERALQEGRAIRAAGVEAQALILLGQVATDQGRNEQAVDLLTRAIAAAEAGAADPARARATAELGVVLGTQQRRPVEGERLLRLAAAVDLRVGAGPIEQARRDMLLGILQSERGEYDLARQTLLAATEALRAAQAPRLQMIQAFIALGLVEERSGRDEAARKYYGDALALAEDRLGPDHPDVAMVLNNIGVLEWRAGRAEEAIASLERALDIRVRTLGPDHPEIATSRMNLGNALLAIEAYDRASKSFEQAAAALRRRSGSEGDLADTLYNLAICHHMRGDFPAAARIYEEALQRSQAIFGPDHPEVAFAMNGLGVALVELGRLDEARPLLERTLAIRTRRGVEPVDLGEVRFALARTVVGRDRRRALELASTARSDYEKERASEQVALIDAWLLAQLH
ncbi:serine/threonine-protein kinase [Nannocystis radixulma]|uniref:Serine/threonine-protein kinase n=1 Tax=Nannocystis radixulma TaxID=2995305 RepID=A0ABT5BJG6_9BACT|nr:serine/threonine-protein kinase [Nannocystis radixulma]MDC0674297.1 serine/threonine-protein kinase [Nannocystis radixulma]